MIQFEFCQNFCRWQIIFANVASVLLFSLNCFAITTSTLPTEIYSPAIRVGHISGLDQRFNDAGTLNSLTDRNAIEFDAKTLSKFNAKAENLIATLNRFGAFKMGDALNLGVLEIQARPEIDYTAPLLAKGVTKRWTVAVGLPVVHYQNKVTLSQSFSNIGYYKSQFSGLSKELDQALDTNLGESTQQVLAQRGYRRLEDRDEKFLGDAQLVSLYKLYDSPELSLIHQATINLPTGPKYDANDLLALNTFHKTSIENTLALTKQISPSWKITPYTCLKYTLPEKIDARVPLNEDDTLPDQNSIESVTRKDGASYEVGLQNSVELSDAFQVTLDYKIGEKAADQYAGDRNTRYDLLGKESKSKWQKSSIEFAYSSVKSYFKNSSSVPFILSLNFFDTLAGQNIERRFGQEASFTLFF